MKRKAAVSSRIVHLYINPKRQKSQVLAVSMAELLVSVRSVVEAEAALAGGAAILDVKEPSRGSLGRSEEATIGDVIRLVAGRRPVTAALGELRDNCTPFRRAGLSFAKWGLSGCGSWSNWQRELAATAERLHAATPSCQLVAVAYADWQRAEAPSPQAVCQWVSQNSCGAFLLDTWEKDGTTLLDWLCVGEVLHLCRSCRAAGVGVALAGSLRPAEIARLQPVEPDWFAVRGSVCYDGRRERGIDPKAVRRLADFLEGRSGLAGTEVESFHG